MELPEGSDLEQVQESGAIQLFVQHARKVKPAFRLTNDNAHDVSEICRRLDGLPLAIELSAARARALSPAALLSRLDKALDIPAGGHQRPSRQKTLRDTIAWSYDLLSPTQQVFFRRLGVFAGGADLEAISAVTAHILGDADPLDLAVDLMDASLATITDDEASEPRVGVLFRRDLSRGSRGVLTGPAAPLVIAASLQVVYARAEYVVGHALPAVRLSVDMPRSQPVTRDRVQQSFLNLVPTAAKA